MEVLNNAAKNSLWKRQPEGDQQPVVTVARDVATIINSRGSVRIMSSHVAPWSSLLPAGWAGRDVALASTGQQHLHTAYHSSLHRIGSQHYISLYLVAKGPMCR